MDVDKVTSSGLSQTVTFSVVDDCTFADDFLRLFDTSFQKT